MLSRQLTASWLAYAWFGLTLVLAQDGPTPFSEYVLTPRSRTLLPLAVYEVNGSVTNADALTTSGTHGTATFHGVSVVTYDFGKNVGGIVSFETPRVTGSHEHIGITFSESKLYISSLGSDATSLAPDSVDRPLAWRVSAGSSYAADKSHERGGFRYLTVYHNTTGLVDLANLTVHFTAVPQIADSDLGNHYTGYFHSNSEKLNRVWYAGAYTAELCTIDATAGNSLIFLTSRNVQQVKGVDDWYNNATITNGTTALVDGARRDRLVWPGDLTVELPTVFVSTYFLDTITTSLDSLLVLQQADGALPYAGTPYFQSTRQFSFTYHLHSLIAIWNHYLWTGDVTYLEKNWPVFKLGLAHALTFIDNSGMAYVTSNLDWLRYNMNAHNIEANALLYHVLTLAVKLAAVVDDESDVPMWTASASAIKAAANARLWDGSANLYRDNDTAPLTSLHPQDGNVWAVIANLTLSHDQNVAISKALQARWTRYGAPAPEAGPTVSPYISGLELQAHYLAGSASAAVTLMESMWADFMLDDPRMTNSTFMEGYSTDGRLKYSPYVNDVRVNFAHGWATGPTSALTVHAAGLRPVDAAGKLWLVSPSLGGLTDVRAGFRTTAGAFSVLISAPPGAAVGAMTMNFTTPPGTSGSVSVEAPPNGGSLTIEGPTAINVPIPAGSAARFQVDGLAGGSYQVVVSPQ